MTGRGRVLVVDDAEIIRESLGPLLEDEGYHVSFAENGRQALSRLYNEDLPDIIVLDLKMPVMDGWEFRTIQKEDVRLGQIPVVAISADGNIQESAVSAQAFLRKPVDGKHLTATIERLLLDNKREASDRSRETQRLTALGRMAAGVGHEINNPLAFLLLNLGQSLEELRSAAGVLGVSLPGVSDPESDLQEIRARMASVMHMLEDCQIGGERIRETVSNLQRLSRPGQENRSMLDVGQLIEQSASMAWNHIRHRARLIKNLGQTPPINGNGTALGQVFLNLLVNAAQAIPEGEAERNEIRVSTKVQFGEEGAELVVEISDTGPGIAPDVMPHLFEPFFTTKAVGQGTGLGLAISRQAITDHGGRLTVESEFGHGTTFRVFLPIGDPQAPSSLVAALTGPAAVPRGRILIIDDEPLIGSVIRDALKGQHFVYVVQRASEALTLLEDGERFDLILCDVVMPDINGPELYATIAERWPQLLVSLVFMTGGAFTPGTIEFVEHMPRVLSKPFGLDGLTQLINERIRGSA